MSLYIHTDAYTDVNVGMGIGILNAMDFDWDSLTADEKRFLIAIRERRMPKWMQRRFEEWKAAQEKKEPERSTD